MLLCCVLPGAAGAAPDSVGPDTPAPATAPEEGTVATLDRLIADLRELHAALGRGIDESAAVLAERLPELRARLDALEQRLRRQLPALREELRELEERLREAMPTQPKRQTPPAQIEV
jgi:ElaB/YqjD/DUF883 family membrane-anchored ribosome-binding protein